MLDRLCLVTVIEGIEHLGVVAPYAPLDEVVVGESASSQFLAHLVIEGCEGRDFPPDAIHASLLPAAMTKFWFNDFIAFNQLAVVGFSK